MTTHKLLSVARAYYYLAVVLSGTLLAQVIWAATGEDVAIMKSPDRQKILIEGARKEGKLTWYTTLIVDQVARPVKEAFEKEYPFIQTELFRGNSERVVQKILAEYQAKRYDVDIVDGTVSPVMVKRAGLLQRFSSPFLSEYPAELKDPQGFWATMNVYFFAVGYNTRMVKPNEVPKTYEDLLNPRWKGQMIWSTSRSMAPGSVPGRLSSSPQIIITGTLGKALGGASGGCVSGRKEVVELCRQKARPYLFSNAVPPPIAYAAIKVLEILSESTERRDRLEENTKFWRQALPAAGFVIKEGDSPIVPVMLFNAKLSQDIARDLFSEGIYVIGFFFPVVAAGQARIRTQMSADHDIPMLRDAIEAFKRVGDKHGIRGLDKKGIIEKFGL